MINKKHYSEKSTFNYKYLQNDKNIAHAIKLALSPDDTSAIKYKNHFKILMLDKSGKYNPVYNLIRPDNAINDIKKIIVSNNRDIYITANTYKGEVISEKKYKNLKEQGLNTNLYVTSFSKKKGYKSVHCKKNLFSYKNIVLDIDWHDISENEIKVFSSIIINNINLYTGEFLVPNIINFTGRGLQLWWCIKEESYKLQYLIKNITKELINKINNALKNDPWIPIGSKIDEAASLNNAGLFRMFGTKNTKSTLSPKVYIIKDTKYTVDELKDNLNIIKKPSYTKKHVFYNNSFLNRVTELENFITTDKSIPENRHIKLHLLYNALVTANIQNAKEKIFEINKCFKKPLRHKDIESIFNTIDKNGVYKYKNTTIASKLGIKNFGTKYKNSTVLKLAKLREITKKKKEIRNLYICEAFAKTNNYKEAAKAGNVCLNTAKKVIAECADIITALIKKIEHTKERKIFAYFLNHKHKRKQVKNIDDYHDSKNIIVKFLNIRNHLLKKFPLFFNKSKPYLTLSEYLSFENHVLRSGLYNYSKEEIHIAIAPYLQIIR